MSWIRRSNQTIDTRNSAPHTEVDFSFYKEGYQRLSKKLGPTEASHEIVLGSPLITRPQDCNGCQECVLHCPDFAIQVTRKPAKREED